MEIIISALMSIITLTLMEIVLGIDNIVFISILTGNLEEKLRPKARFMGLSLALIVRVILLSLATVLIGLSKPYNVFGLFEFSFRDLIMFIGGTFLLYSAVKEIYHKTTDTKEEEKVSMPFHKVIINIVFIDIVFSFDSILTAIGLVQSLWIMVTAVILSMIVMIIFSGKIANFIEKFPSIKMLALSFLLMIGFILILDAFHIHVPKGYIYYAMFFSLFVVLLNIKNDKNEGHLTKEEFAEAKAYLKIFSTSSYQKADIDKVLREKGNTGDPNLDAEYNRFIFLKETIMETAVYWETAALHNSANNLKSFLKDNNIESDPMSILKKKK